MNRLNLLIGLFFLALNITAKSDKARLMNQLVLKDSLKVKSQKNYPARAALLSTILPGSGQVYNKRIWKVPFIYGAFAGCAYVYQSNNSLYKKYKNALSTRYDDDPLTIDDYSNFTDENLVLLKNQYRKRRDLGTIGIVAIYLLNIIDASVDAHLREFDVKINEDISMTIFPYTQFAINNVPANFGLQFKLNFR
jgi:hypothetical protein